MSKATGDLRSDAPIVKPRQDLTQQILPDATGQIYIDDNTEDLVLEDLAPVTGTEPEITGTDPEPTRPEKTMEAVKQKLQQSADAIGPAVKKGLQQGREVIGPAVEKAAAAVAGSVTKTKDRLSTAPGAIKTKIDRVKPSLAPKARGLLLRPLVSDQTLARIKHKGAFKGLARALSKVRVVQVILLAAVLLISIVLIVGMGNSDAPQNEQTATTAKQEQTSPTAGALSVPANGSPDATPAAAVPPAEATPEVSCKPLSAYPAFPWKDLTDALVKTTQKDGICNLLNLSPDQVSEALSHLPHLGPTGYDLIPGGEEFDIFPGGLTHRMAPVMRFLFVSGKLFEIHLDYRESFADQLQSPLFEDALGKPVKSAAPGKNAVLQRFADGSLVVEYTVSTDAHKRVFRKVVFASKTIREGIRRESDNRDKAQRALEKGVISLNLRNYKDAIKRFRRARRLIPSYGAAFVWEAMTLVQLEKFKEATALSERALEVSRDNRARAEALGLQAVSALFTGSKERALELFVQAKALDPTNLEFSKSVQELETGEYKPDRVAKTAGRMTCIKEAADKKEAGKNPSGWTEAGILARGNFPDGATYAEALKKAEASDTFNREYQRWVNWECR